MKIDASTLQSLFSYDPVTGAIAWRVSRGRAAAGSIAGSVNNTGTEERPKFYRIIRIYGRNYYAHHIAWAIKTGAWPLQMLDHKDHDGTNNAWLNLHLATNAANQHNRRGPQRNNTSGYQGVSCSSNGRFIAKIKVNMRRIYLGEHAAAEAAYAAYLDAKRQMHLGNLL